MDEGIRRLRESNARLVEAAEMLRRTRLEVEAMHAETMRQMRANIRVLEALIARLEGRAG